MLQIYQLQPIPYHSHLLGCSSCQSWLGEDKSWPYTLQSDHSLYRQSTCEMESEGCGSDSLCYKQLLVGIHCGECMKLSLHLKQEELLISAVGRLLKIPSQAEDEFTHFQNFSVEDLIPITKVIWIKVVN